MEKDSRFMEMFEFDLSGVECHYAYLVKPDTKYESVWKVTVVLPDQLAADMAKVGFNVVDKELGGRPVKAIVAKRKTHTREGKAMYPPRIYDAGTAESQPSAWPEDVAIGNGSILNLKVAAVYREVSGKTLLPLYLNAVQVVKHVPYNGSPFGSVGETNQPF